jgi:DNA-binding CsgD family transcriptional regulator
MELLLANAKAQRLLDRGDGFQLVDRTIRADDPASMRQLQAMAAGQSEDRSFTFSAVGRQGQRFLLQALAVSPNQSNQFASTASGTALMIIGGQRMDISEAAIEALQHGFDLTAAEARLAAFLIEGSGVHGYADARGVSVEAGKYLLKSIYAKTGLSNQTELVALLREAPLGWGKPLPAIT